MASNPEGSIPQGKYLMESLLLTHQPAQHPINKGRELSEFK